MLAALVSAAAPALSPALASNPARDVSFRRAEFWDRGSATLLDVVNVVGRWESTEEWKVRTDFVEVEDPRKQGPEQGATKQRYEMAQRLGQVERTALQQNVGKLRFKDERLASAVGLRVEDFAELEINPVAVNIVYDALAQSKSSMLPPEVIDSRRRAWLDESGGLNELAFRIGLYRARFTVICSWFLFGKGNILGIIVVLKVISDFFPSTQAFYDSIFSNQEGLLVAASTAGMMAYVGQQEDAQMDRKVAEKREQKAQSDVE